MGETWISLSDSRTQLLTPLFSSSVSLNRVLDSRATSIKVVNDPIALGMGGSQESKMCVQVSQSVAWGKLSGGGSDNVSITFHGSRTWYQMATQ